VGHIGHIGPRSMQDRRRVKTTGSAKVFDNRAGWNPGGERISDIGEDVLLNRLFDSMDEFSSSLLIPPGDDAAAVVFPENSEIVATCDSQVEGVHFRRSWVDPTELGHRAAVAGLSDLAAMGATPHCAMLSLMLEVDTFVGVVLNIFRGIKSQLGPAGAEIVGGNLSRSVSGLTVDLSLLGFNSRGSSIRRSGAAEGDIVYVSGFPGMAGACVALLQRDMAVPRQELLAAVRAPEHRVSLARLLTEFLPISAMMDISDGLARDLQRLGMASDVGIEIDKTCLPLGPGLEETADLIGDDASRLVLGSSDDYELLFTLSPIHANTLEELISEKNIEVSITPIGYCTGSPPGLRLDYESGMGGWEHFSPRH